MGLIDLVTNGSEEGITGFPTKTAPVKLAMKGKKWAIKAVILGPGRDRLAESVPECLLLIGLIGPIGCST